MFSTVLFVALLGTAAATTGLDAIQPMSASTFTCLKQNGYSFFIARAWESTGNYDETGIQNIKNARAAGWEYVDAYIFPCLRSGCAAPAAQVEATVNRLNSEGAKFGMIWLDIEILNWPSDQNSNRNFINAMGNKLNAMGVNWGIYTNNNNWGSIVGISWNQWASRPLWWANYNGHQDYTGFVPFGGWSKPAIHQYAGDYKGPCSVDLDLNWY
ncbi:unnamed protein product [Nippostrongylus brasiliensis]|uniref:Glycosyl hydrolase family 25 n=1 Tax=Nippostrongylus brasiliensis TaxID=27835 RepID=A0A0N4XTH2_NIPBR|nr:hypothetical protein Q1695_000434 [Nippostrongylus brasiliensis]VDL69488.1 unnamed protein product [Nippostrongylus brasiliensis]